jgi:hypothetical protein
MVWIITLNHSSEVILTQLIPQRSVGIDFWMRSTHYDTGILMVSKWVYQHILYTHIGEMVEGRLDMSRLSYELAALWCNSSVNNRWAHA